MKIAILGGGLSGLCLGNAFRKDFTIYEKKKDCGGLCRSICEDGFTFDIGGSHIIFSQNHPTLQYMLSQLAGNVKKNYRNTKILYKQRYIKYPFENGLYNLPIKDNLECLFTFLQNTIKKSLGRVSYPLNFGEWMYYTFGRGITEKYLLPYNTKIWNYPPEKMGIQWVNGRVPSPPIIDIIKSSFGITTEGYRHQLNFYYPRHGGIQALVEALKNPISEFIHTNITLDKIQQNDNNFIVRLANGVQEEYDHVISTIPLQELVPLIENIPSNVRDAVNNLKYNSLITIMIGVNDSSLKNISWLYLPLFEQGPMHRVSFPSNYSPYVAPKGMSSILAEITCTPRDQMWDKDNQEILASIIEKLDALGILDKKMICYTNIHREKYAYVIFDKYYKENMGRILSHFSQRGIDLCGRFAEFKYINMDVAIENALATANKIRDKRG